MCEILAPAGGESGAYAAINAGADAIYLGLDRFSARSSAENFDMQKFAKTCKYAHAFGVKVYVALNTVVKDGELSGFLNSAADAWDAGADALIIQDLFLGEYIKKHNPRIVLHLSTQAGTCNAYGARLAKQAGFDRVILARETKLEDIAAVSEIIQTEVFIQGALCTCFSGQCYMSSFAGGNSGNRGKCKQPCRKKYSLDRSGFVEQAYRLSLSDLCVGRDIKRLADAGVYSFKIEGRMRRPEYVAAAVRYYKNVFCADENKYLSDLKRTFNRGNYTKGLAFGQDKSFISSAVQGHIGELAGIINVQNAKYICRSVLKFKRGDGFKILRGGREVGGGIFGGEVKGGFIINTRDRLKNGDKAFITTDAALNAKLLSEKRLIPLKIKLDFTAGERAVAEINGVRFLSGSALERAKNSALNAEQLKRCFEKTDSYPFASELCSVITDNAFAPVSELNAFRRRVYAEYFEMLSANANKACARNFAIPEFKPQGNAKTAVICTDLNGVAADVGILKPGGFFADCVKLIKNFAGEKFLYIPPYLTGEEMRRAETVAAAFDGIYCDGYFGRTLADKTNKKFFAGTGFNITNKISLMRCRADYVCLSKELTLAEAGALSRENAFYLTAGNIKVMDLIYCPFEKKCASCDKRAQYALTDEDGRKFPLRRYTTPECRFEVYNCADLVSGGCAAGRLFDCTLVNDANEVVSAYSRGEAEKYFKNYTRGHSASGIF